MQLKVIWAGQCENVYMAYADSKGPDQRAYPRSPIRDFAIL